jgi:hypothetical protein
MKSIVTADKIMTINHNFPQILKVVYTEDKERIQYQCEDEADVLKAFEARKTDTKYFQMLEKKK